MDLLPIVQNEHRKLMGFKLTPSTNNSSFNIDINDTTISTKIKNTFLTVSNPVNEFTSTSHTISVKLNLVTLQDPWPNIQVTLSRQYECYS